LSVASIFLCGIVATYVANADNFKEKYEAANTRLGRADADVTAANDEVNRLKASTEQDKGNLQAEIGRLKSELASVQGELTQAENKRDQLQNSVDQLTSQVEAQGVTNAKWQDMLKAAEAELMKVNAELTKLGSQNKQVTAAILEKMAIITQLEAQAQELTKENEKLQAALVQVWRNYNKTVGRSPTITDTIPGMGKAQPQLPAPRVEPVSPEIRELGLKGVVSQVDLKNSLAEISIGAADGVKDKMKFYATRGDAFICEILILDVYAERAVGFLERVQSPPKAGDSVSTSLGS
jgi:septal ring factor EnvC (AmiA/AmiB activator)